MAVLTAPNVCDAHAERLKQFECRTPLTFSNISIFCARAGNSLGVACGVAIVAALATGLLLPKRYTATATILIDPPAGGDPRIATAVSTVYLESLKTYELLATNDQLFVRAAATVPSSRPRRIAHRIAETAGAEGRQTPRHAGAADQRHAAGSKRCPGHGAVYRRGCGGTQPFRGKEADEAMIEDARQGSRHA